MVVLSVMVKKKMSLHTHTDEIRVDGRYIFPPLIPPMVVVVFIIVAN